MFDDTSSLADGAQVTYRAVLTYAPGKTVTSDTRTVTIVQARVTTATIHYNRPDGDYAAWGLHLFGDGLAPGEAHRRVDEPDAVRGHATRYGALHRIGIADDTKRVGFIVHRRPPGDPNTKDTRHRPVLHPARHAGDLAAAGRRADLQLRGGQRHLRRAVRVGGVGSNRGRPPHRGSGRHREQGRSQ